MNYIHPTAIVYDNVILGDNIMIGPYCVIGSPPEHSRQKWNEPCGKVSIGDNTVIYKHVTIDAACDPNRTTVIGEDCILMAHSHIGHDCFIKDKVTICSGAVIGGHSFIDELCTVSLNATLHPRTRISRGSIVGAGSFVKGEWIQMYAMLVGSPAKFIGHNKRLIDKLGLNYDY